MSRQKFERVDQDTYREENREEVERVSEDRIAKMIHDLETTAIDFDMSKEAQSEEEQMAAYRKNAGRGLKAILARAAALEAKANADK